MTGVEADGLPAQQGGRQGLRRALPALPPAARRLRHARRQGSLDRVMKDLIAIRHRVRHEG